MIKDAVREILEVEQEMRAILTEAQELARQVVEEARLEAQVRPEQARKEAEAEAAARVAEAKREAEVTRQRIIAEAEAEAARLAEIAKTHLEEAIVYVLSQIMKVKGS